MVQFGFYLGERDWWIMGFLDIKGEKDLSKTYGTLLASGCPDYKAQEACMILSRENTGYTYTDFDAHTSLLFVSRATSAEQMFDSILHEVKHLTEHISEYYGLNPKEELSAYLQGELGRKLFPAASIVLCPHCNYENNVREYRQLR